MNSKDLPRTVIVKRKRVKIQKILGKQISTLAGIRRKLLIGKARNGTFLEYYEFHTWNSYMKIKKSFLNYSNSLCTIFKQNVPIRPNCILPTHSSTKCFNTLEFYTINTHFYNSSINIRSISFFSSSDAHQSHHLLLGFHATGINSSFNSALWFSNLKVH